VEGKYDHAIADFSKALSIDPQYLEVYVHRGMAWARKDQYDKAIADYKRAIEINPDYAVAYNQLAWIYAACPDGAYRNGTRAVMAAQKAVSLRQTACFFDTLSAAYAEMGRFDDAKATQKKAIELLMEEGKDYELEIYKQRLACYENGKPWHKMAVMTQSNEDVTQFLDSWRKAWERADLIAYLMFYHPEARQGGYSGKDEIAARKRLLWKKNNPRAISFRQVKTRPHGDGVLVEFEQCYSGNNGYQDMGRKRLLLIPDGESWLIMLEEWKPH
jgi:tetratricopeptide (TPR) repeat protein